MVLGDFVVLFVFRNLFKMQCLIHHLLFVHSVYLSNGNPCKLSTQVSLKHQSRHVLIVSIRIDFQFSHHHASRDQRSKVTALLWPDFLFLLLRGFE